MSDPEETQTLIRDTVRQTLLELGLNIERPGDIIELQKDFQHLRNWRKSVETLGLRGVLFALGVFISGALGAFLLGIKNILGSHS